MRHTLMKLNRQLDFSHFRENPPLEITKGGFFNVNRLVLLVFLRLPLFGGNRHLQKLQK